jgi:hypothetical protein
MSAAVASVPSPRKFGFNDNLRAYSHHLNRKKESVTFKDSDPRCLGPVGPAARAPAGKPSVGEADPAWVMSTTPGLMPPSCTRSLRSRCRTLRPAGPAIRAAQTGTKCSREKVYTGDPDAGGSCIMLHAPGAHWSPRRGPFGPRAWYVLLIGTQLDSG